MHALHPVWKCLHASCIHFASPASSVICLYPLCISGCKIAFFLHPFCIHCIHSVETPCIPYLWLHPHFIHNASHASHASPLHLQYILNASNLGMQLQIGNFPRGWQNSPGGGKIALVYGTSIWSPGCFCVALFLVQKFLYSSSLKHKLVQQILAPLKKRVHNGAVKSHGQLNHNLKMLLVATFYTLQGPK